MRLVPKVLLKACRRCASTLAVRQRSKVVDSCRAASCVLRLQELTQGDEADALSDVPNIFATLGNPPVGPPFRSTTDPCLPLLLWVQSFQRQAELEVIHLLRAARATSVSIDGLHLRTKSFGQNQSIQFLSSQDMTTHHCSLSMSRTGSNTRECPQVLGRSS